MPNLIIFIDSFPYRFLKQTEFMKSFKKQYKITPNFGYSVNLHAELFAGLKTDEVGYFGEWNFDLQKNINLFDKIIAKLGFARRFSPLIDRGLHRILNRYLKYECANIPFQYLHLFSRIGGYPLKTGWKYKTLFDNYGFEKIVSDFLPLPLGDKDEYSFSRTLEVIDGGRKNIFVSFPDLDGIAHKFGINSLEYVKRIKNVDMHCKKLAEKFISYYSEGEIIIVSDHGMANATEPINLQLESKFGRVKPGKLVYFYDSLYLRIWVWDLSLKKEIISFLQESKVGNILTERERTFWGLSNSSFGDIIFLLKEGYAFVPNYFGLRLQKAYHGYHPELESQKGIFLHSNDIINDRPGCLLDVYNSLKKNFVN